MTDAAHDGPPAPPAQQTTYPLSDRRPLMNTGLQALHAIAPTLKEGQLKIAIALAALAEDDSHHSVTIGARELCRRANLAPSAFPQAIKALEERKLITIRHGTASTKNAYLVNFLNTIRPVSFGETPPTPLKETPPSLFEIQSVPFAEAPPTGNTALAPAAAALSISSASLHLIDRVYSARPEEFDPNLLTTFRSWLHGYMTKLGRDDANQPLQNPHPPGSDLVAHFLAIADPRRLGTLLDSLMLDRATCYSYGWFVIVALQRVHGIHFQEQKAARAALHDVKRLRQAPATPPPPAEPGELFAAPEFVRQAVASGKKLR